MKRMSKKSVVVGAAVGALLGLTVTAFAFWTTSGSGSGTSSTEALEASNLSFDQSTVNAMYPGDDPQTFSVEVTNNADHQTLEVTSVKAYITTDKGDDCTVSDFLLNGVEAPSTALTAADLGWTPQELAAGGSASTDDTDTIQFNDKTDTNQDLCQSAVVTINYVAA